MANDWRRCLFWFFYLYNVNFVYCSWLHWSRCETFPRCNVQLNKLMFILPHLQVRSNVFLMYRIKFSIKTKTFCYLILCNGVYHHYQFFPHSIFLLFIFSIIPILVLDFQITALNYTFWYTIYGNKSAKLTCSNSA